MRTLLDLLGIRAGELRAALPAFALAFLSVGALGLSGIAADTLFVSAFSLGEISRFYVVSSVVRVAVAFGYAALARRFDGPRFDAAVFAAAALEMTISAAVVDRGHSAIYVACVAQLLLPPLLPLVAFNRVMSCFHARQAKRLLPLIAAAATLGSIVVGALAGPIVVGFGTRALLFAGGALCVVSLPLPGLLAARAGEAQDAPAPAPNEGAGGLRATLRDTVRDIRTVAVVRVVVVNAFLAAAATNLVDFAFKAALKERYGRDEMASFLGAFNVAANTVVLFAQVFLTSRFVGRFGVRASLRAFPASLLVLGPAIGAAAGVATGAAAKFAEIALRFSLGAAVADLILTPSSPQVRTRAKVFVKGIAGPLGYLAAGLILAIFGAGGPPPIVLGALLFAVGLCGVVALSGARRAYTSALAKALGEGRIELDVSPNAAAVLRDELARIVARSSAEGDTRTAIRTLAILGDRFFDLRDIAPALHSPFPEIRRAAVQAALRVARPGEGEPLLAMAPPDEDDDVEVKLVAGARSLGAVPPRDRIERALARTSGATSGPAIALWAEALLCLALTEKDPAVKKLRKAAAEDAPAASARRAAALRALGDLRERRAEREVLRAMASSDPAIFAQAARAAVLIEAQGAIPTLIAALLHGSNIRAAGRALALAGPSAINELIAALPTTRGEGAVAPTAVASAREITGTVRAARVLARLGPEACARVLARFSDLGYRGRNAVARAFAAMKWSAGRAVDQGAVTRAMELTLSYAETLTLAAPHVWATAGQDPRPPSNETPRAGQNPRPASNLLAHEIHHRIAETAARMLDLASVIGDRALIARARSGLAREGRDRGHALELLENVLPKPLAARCVAVIEEQGGSGRTAPQGADDGGKQLAERSPADARRPVVFDGWLEKCRKFDKNELPSGDPMLGVLEKVLVLSGASLFAGLSGEELYPVAEIAEATLFASGDTVVRQGDPGDALFVVASGTFVIVKGETKVHELGEGAVFGELALLDGAPRAATVIAATDGQLLRIPRAEFEALLDESPELARGVIRTLVGHLRGGT